MDTQSDTPGDPEDKQAFIEAHMQRSKAEDERWKTMSTEEMFAAMNAISDTYRQRTGESAWDRIQQHQTAQPPGPTAPLAPLPSYRTTVADLADMRTQDSHPTWFQAAYVDLAQRLIRVEAQLEDQATTLSLLHSKVEDLLEH